MSDNKDFLPQRGNYENLAVYKLATCIYAVTYHFANTYFSKGDRTIDQMVQAARSGKQNIAEGSVDGIMSTEMEIKLMNVARGSMHELKADYEDYLIHQELEQWSSNAPGLSPHVGIAETIVIQTCSLQRLRSDPLKRLPTLP